MKWVHWLKHEARAVVLATLYFFLCFFVLMLIKRLLLADYGIRVQGLAAAAVAALVAAKVVLLLDRPAPGAIARLPAAVEVLLRTACYTLLALALVWLEHAIEKRAEHGGVLAAAAALAERRDAFHVWVAGLAAALAFFGYAAFSVVRRHVGGPALAALFFTARR